MSIKMPRQILLIFLLLSFVAPQLYAQRDARPGLYKQIETLCNRKSTLKMSKKKVSKICACVVAEHKAKELDLQSVQALYKRYSQSKAVLKMDAEDQTVIAAYDDDTVYDCIGKFK